MKLYIQSFLFIAMIMHQAYSVDQICPSPLPGQYQNVQAGNIVAAYFGNWDIYAGNSYQIDHIAAVADKLTHIIYGFMKPDAEKGICRPHDVWADAGAYDDVQSKIGGNFAKLIELKKQFPHLKILLSIGGGTYNKNFIALAQDHKKLMNFAQSCVNMLDFYDHPFLLEGKYKRINHLSYEGLFDGLDIDWEWESNSLTPELAQSYAQFIRELRRLLKLRDAATKNQSLLTVALQVAPKIYKALPLREIASSVDWFNIMAYDFFGPSNKKIGFNAPVCGSWAVYSIDGAMQRIMEQGVSPEKMVLGLPLYGYVYEDTDGLHAPISKQDKMKAVSYHVIKQKYINNPSYEKTWNSKERIPSLYSKKDRTFISYDEQESLAEKVEFAKNKRMQGVVLWRLSGDDAEHSMVHAITKAMNA